MTHLDLGGQRGQTLVVFVLSLVAIIAGVGLVLDLGGTWAQQRNQQRAADLAALAGATSEANGGTRAQMMAAALASAQANGFASSEVVVNIPPTQGRYGPGGPYYSSNDCSSPAAYPCAVEVTINRAHQNGFAGVVGLTSFPVSARGTAIGGIANNVVSDAAPLMFNVAAVEPGNISSASSPQTYCNPQPAQCPGNDPVPLGTGQFTYTQFCIAHPTTCNVDSNIPPQILSGGDLRPYPVFVGMNLGPNNAGQHTNVCQDLQAYVGQNLAVAIVDGSGKDGTLVGYWIFHLTAVPSCSGPNGEQIMGYFVSDQTDSLPLTVTPGGGHATTGIPVVRLVD